MKMEINYNLVREFYNKQIVNECLSQRNQTAVALPLYDRPCNFPINKRTMNEDEDLSTHDRELYRDKRAILLMFNVYAI